MKRSSLIAVLAGWLALVPVVIIVIMFFAGMILQRKMTAATIDAQADAGLQHSLLVEAIGGSETLKANAAEGRMIGRWRNLARMKIVGVVRNSLEHDELLRHYPQQPRREAQVFTERRRALDNRSCRLLLRVSGRCRHSPPRGSSRLRPAWRHPAPGPRRSVRAG